MKYKIKAGDGPMETLSNHSKVKALLSVFEEPYAFIKRVLLDEDIVSHGGKLYVKEQNGTLTAYPFMQHDNFTQALAFTDRKVKPLKGEIITVKPNALSVLVETRASYTPGPWRVHSDLMQRVEDGCGNMICACTDIGEPGAILRTTKANAALIAAAPDLLEALKLANQAFNDHFLITDNDEGGNHVHDQIREAIKKAQP